MQGRPEEATFGDGNERFPGRGQMGWEGDEEELGTFEEQKRKLALPELCDAEHQSATRNLHQIVNLCTTSFSKKPCCMLKKKKKKVS